MKIFAAPPANLRFLALSLMGVLTFACGGSAPSEGPANAGGTDSGSGGKDDGSGGKDSTSGGSSPDGGKSSSGGKDSGSGGKDSSSGGKDASSGGDAAGGDVGTGGTSGGGGMGGTGGDGGGSSTGGAPPGVDCEFLSDIDIKTQAEFDDLVAEGCATIDVSVTISGKEIASLSGLEPLREVKGDLVLAVRSVTDASPLVNLERVEGTLTIDHMGEVGKLNLSSLSYVGGLFSVSSNAKITELRCPLLVEAVDGLSVVENTALVTISMDKLTTADKLTMFGNGELLTFGGLPSLTTVDFVNISMNAKLPQCEVDDLETRIGVCQNCQNNDAAATCD